MRFRPSGYALLLILASAFVYASDWNFNYRPAAVRYVIYGNSLGDSIPPSVNDQKIAFEITGRSAREIFDAIGPDLKDSCSSEPGIRFHSRDEERIACTKTKNGDYTCYFGFDLKSGKSIGGSICRPWEKRLNKASRSPSQATAMPSKVRRKAVAAPAGSGWLYR